MQRDPERPPDEEDRRPGVPPHQPDPGPGRDRVEEEAEESFPSSDPPPSGSPGI